MRNKKNLYFYLIPVMLIINVITAWYIKDYISPDSKDYIEIAKNLPRISNSLFPVFYPFLLKIITYLTTDYLISYKIINICSIIFCLFYTFKNKFYYKEIWLMLALSSFQYVYIYAWSENVIIPLLIVYCHLVKKFIDNKISNKAFFFKMTICLVLLFSTKYSSIFFSISLGGFSMLQLKNNRKYFSPLFSILIFLVIVISYLALNYVITGYITGNRHELEAIKIPFDKYISISKYQILSTLEPFGIPFSKLIFFNNFFFWQLPYFLSIILFFAYIIYIVKNSKFIVTKYFFFLFITSFLFFTLTILSAFFTRIDILGPRLLIGFNLPLLLSSFEYAKSNNIKLNYKLLLLIIVISFVLNIYTSVNYGFK